MLMEVSL
jgi:hypothetical protein